MGHIRKTRCQTLQVRTPMAGSAAPYVRLGVGVRLAASSALVVVVVGSCVAPSRGLLPPHHGLLASVASRTCSETYNSWYTSVLLTAWTFKELDHQPAHYHAAMQDAHENVLACHAQERLGDTTCMLQALTMRDILPVVLRITMHGAPLLAALPPMGGGIPYCLVSD